MPSLDVNVVIVVSTDVISVLFQAMISVERTRVETVARASMNRLVMLVNVTLVIQGIRVKNVSIFVCIYIFLKPP